MGPAVDEPDVGLEPTMKGARDGDEGASRWKGPECPVGAPRRTGLDRPGKSMAMQRSLPTLREGQRSRSSRSSSRSGPERGLRAEVEADAAPGSVSPGTRHPSGLFARQQVAISTC